MTRCLVWAGELVDTHKAGEGLGSDTLYLGLVGLDVAKKIVVMAVTPTLEDMLIEERWIEKSDS
ncbi:hypothetical protein E2562_017137 [Oryza meyeriana var. granulata]|uniref:Uncharacterized protein n=1 Tax=Oryza meyeriana var. granulata TaxID=110450 RepID=A0A6G1DXM7_9ORYZ|nr:hypothetical protein E2562_017137 [Oryza meyeriana var. granulata]